MNIDPPTTNVSLWLKSLGRENLHEQGWMTINQRFHGIARAARPFIQANFPDGADQEAAFDGFTLALLAVSHFEDIEQLSHLLDECSPTTHQTKNAPQPKVAQQAETDMTT